jgi:hypothetical protein
LPRYNVDHAAASAEERIDEGEVDAAPVACVAETVVDRSTEVIVIIVVAVAVIAVAD